MVNNEVHHAQKAIMWRANDLKATAVSDLCGEICLKGAPGKQPSRIQATYTRHLCQKQ